MDSMNIAYELKVELPYVHRKHRNDPNWVPCIRVGNTNVYHRLDFIDWIRRNYQCVNGVRVKR